MKNKLAPLVLFGSAALYSGGANACPGCSATQAFGQEEVAEINATNGSVGQLAAQTAAGFTSLITSITLMGELNVNAMSAAGNQVAAEVKRSTKANTALLKALDQNETERLKQKFVIEQKMEADRVYGDDAITDSICKSYGSADSLKAGADQLKSLDELIREISAERKSRSYEEFIGMDMNLPRYISQKNTELIETAENISSLDMSKSKLTIEESQLAIDWIGTMVEPIPLPPVDYYVQNDIKKSGVAVNAAVYEQRKAIVEDVLVDDVLMKIPVVEQSSFADMEEGESILSYMESEVSDSLSKDHISNISTSPRAAVMRQIHRQLTMQNWMSLNRLKRDMNMAKLSTLPALREIERAEMIQFQGIQ